MSHVTAFRDDLERLGEVHARASRCPLGSGALAGSPFAIDREFLAKELGVCVCALSH